MVRKWRRPPLPSWNATLGSDLGLGERPREFKRATVLGAATAWAMVPGKGAGLAMTQTIYFCSYEIDRSPTPRSPKRRTTEEWYSEAPTVHTEGLGTNEAAAPVLAPGSRALGMETAGTSLRAFPLTVPEE